MSRKLARIAATAGCTLAIAVGVTAPMGAAYADTTIGVGGTVPAKNGEDCWTIYAAKVTFNDSGQITMIEGATYVQHQPLVSCVI